MNSSGIYLKPVFRIRFILIRIRFQPEIKKILWWFILFFYQKYNAPTNDLVWYGIFLRCAKQVIFFLKIIVFRWFWLIFWVNFLWFFVNHLLPRFGRLKLNGFGSETLLETLYYALVSSDPDPQLFFLTDPDPYSWNSMIPVLIILVDLMYQGLKQTESSLIDLVTTR